MSTKRSSKTTHAELRPILTTWCAFIRDAMFATGRGYRRYPMGNTGKGTDRRSDKLLDGGFDRATGKHILLPYSPPEGKIKRQARLAQIGIRH